MANQTTWTPLSVEGAYTGTDARYPDHRGYFQVGVGTFSKVVILVFLQSTHS
jgi:hypothetical protein